jgi:hypothetical protein
MRPDLTIQYLAAILAFVGLLLALIIGAACGLLLLRAFKSTLELELVNIFYHVAANPDQTVVFGSVSNNYVSIY